MKRLYKLQSTKGFTLVEMCLVIAIISIMAFLVFKEVGPYLERANNATSAMSEYYDEIDELVGRIE
ncbi:MAG: type II secretion system GspH family protein [Clostridia bacterium]|nr:type II secretion system GspH family protein [Clostridia bacterium]